MSTHLVYALLNDSTSTSNCLQWHTFQWFYIKENVDREQKEIVKLKDNSLYSVEYFACELYTWFYLALLLSLSLSFVPIENFIHVWH